MINSVIIDDEEAGVESVSYYLQTLGKTIRIVGTATNVDEAIHLIDSEQPDLIFLDVEMPGKSGFDLLEHYPAPSFKVVFVTGHNHYALKAIKFSALDYILKPIDPREFKKALQKAELNVENNDPRLDHFKGRLQGRDTTSVILPDTGRLTKIYFSELKFVKGIRGGYSEFHTEKQGTFTVSKPLTYYEDLLVNHRFFRCHRSYLVNLNKIRRLNFNNAPSTIELNETDSIPVATRKIIRLKEILRNEG